MIRLVLRLVVMFAATVVLWTGEADGQQVSCNWASACWASCPAHYLPPPRRWLTQTCCDWRTNYCWSQMVLGWYGCCWGPVPPPPFSPTMGPCEGCH